MLEVAESRSEAAESIVIAGFVKNVDAASIALAGSNMRREGSVALDLKTFWGRKALDASSASSKAATLTVKLQIAIFQPSLSQQENYFDPKSQKPRGSSYDVECVTLTVVVLACNPFLLDVCLQHVNL